MKHLKRLLPQHELAIRMRVEGQPNKNIERELGVKQRTLWRWFSDPLVKTAIKEYQEKISDVFAERMASMGVSALDTLHDLLTENHEGNITVHQKLEVIREILDRMPGLQKHPEQGAGAAGTSIGGNMNVLNFGKMSDEDLIQAARQMAGDIAAQAQLPAETPSG